ncbi:ribosome-recycling factor [Candidatus Parcubacteria bacterium]|nr:ribosome-recycling factor [Candidatus Parcubacteria bacterium]
MDGNKIDANMDGNKIAEWLRKEYLGIRSGQANPGILDSVRVEVYGSPMAINQLATVTLGDSRSLRVVPWDKSVINSIDAAIRESNLGVSVSVDDQGIRVTFPQLTAENRQSLNKLVKQKLEEARIRVRTERQKALNAIEGLDEDAQTRAKLKLQKDVDEINRKLEELSGKKEAEIMA